MPRLGENGGNENVCQDFLFIFSTAAEVKKQKTTLNSAVDGF